MHSNKVQVVLIRLGSDRLYFIRFRVLNTDHLFAGIDQPTCQEQLFEHRRAPLRSGRFRLREWIVLPEPPVTFDLEATGNLLCERTRDKRGDKHSRVENDWNGDVPSIHVGINAVENPIKGSE